MQVSDEIHGQEMNEVVIATHGFVTFAINPFHEGDTEIHTPGKDLCKSYKGCGTHTKSTPANIDEMHTQLQRND